MATTEAATKNEQLRRLPSVDALLSTKTAREISVEAGSQRAAALTRRAIESLRNTITDKSDGIPTKTDLLKAAENDLATIWAAERGNELQRVINATGVIVHTNLGRAPLSDAAIRSVVEKASGNCTLEYDLSSGHRGIRGGLVEKMLTELTGAEAAVVVNNCAAAAFLVLAALAKGGGVIVSRGELVEIGGDFRIPDVLAQSGCELREVGTTNRTKLRDYETAVDENTRLILRVHPSNYRVIGFTETPGLGELAALAHSKGLIVYEDAGSGAIFDLGKYGLCDEPVIGRSIADGADIVTFSGDKLLGGPQAGLIVGRQELLERIRRNPLYRVLRPDKLTYAALGATLSSYAREAAMEEIPVLRMLSISQDEISERAQQFVEAHLTRSEDSGSIKVEVTKGDSVVGGGAAPGMHPETMLISLGSDVFSANQIEQFLRGNRPPVIARIIDDKVVLDLRTVMEKEESELLDAIVSIGNGTHP